MQRKKTFKIAVLLAVGTVSFVFAWENVQATRLGYRIEGLRKEIKDLENSNKYLKKEIQLAISPEKLQSEAIKLGMVYPEPDSIVLLEEQNTNNTAKGWLAKLLDFNNWEL